MQTTAPRVRRRARTGRVGRARTRERSADAPGRRQGQLSLHGRLQVARRCGGRRTPGRSRPCPACAPRNTWASFPLAPARVGFARHAAVLSRRARAGSPTGGKTKCTICARCAAPQRRRTTTAGEAHPLGHGSLFGVIALRGGGVHLLLAALLGRLVARHRHGTAAAARALKVSTARAATRDAPTLAAQTPATLSAQPNAGKEGDERWGLYRIMRL